MQQDYYSSGVVILTNKCIWLSSVNSVTCLDMTTSDKIRPWTKGSTLTLKFKSTATQWYRLLLCGPIDRAFGLHGNIVVGVTRLDPGHLGHLLPLNVLLHSSCVFVLPLPVWGISPHYSKADDDALCLRLPPFTWHMAISSFATVNMYSPRSFNGSRRRISRLWFLNTTKLTPPPVSTTPEGLGSRSEAKPDPKNAAGNQRPA